MKIESVTNSQCKIIDKDKKNSKKILDLKSRTNRWIEGFTDLLVSRIDSSIHVRKAACQAKKLELEKKHQSCRN